MLASIASVVPVVRNHSQGLTLDNVVLDLNQAECNWSDICRLSTELTTIDYEL